MRNRFPFLVSLLAFTALCAACGGESPAGPSRTPQRPAPVELTVTSVGPSAGLPSGGTRVSILGTGFQPGATLTFGGSATSAQVTNSATIVADTPAHPVGTVDVVVTNPSGQTGRLSQGYTYLAADPETAPVVTAVSPKTGSTAGGARVVITGTGFRAGAIVTLDGLPTGAFLYDGSFYLTTAAHAAGSVSFVVTNPDAQSSSLDGGFTFVPPGTFDFNGDWEGGTGAEWATPVRFRIENNVLVSASCGGVAYSTVSSPPVSEGEFSLASDHVVIMTGRILSEGDATGTIDVPPCGRDRWFAKKQGDDR